MVTQTRRRLFSVEEYYAMAEAGILCHDDRVELLAGEIIAMSPTGSRHAASVTGLNHLMTVQLGDRAVVWVQNPVQLDSHSEPEPDVMLLRWRDDFYSSAHPGPDDVLLLIEVSDTTIEFDRNVKLSLYADARIPETWIVNIPDRVVEIYTDPSGGVYGSRRVVGQGESVSPSAFEDVSLPVSQVIPA